MYKVNCNKVEAMETLKKLLLSDEILFRFDVSKKANFTVLTIEKETQKSEYRIHGANQLAKMITFLIELKVTLPTHLKDDVDFVIEKMEVD